mmetsp:Transcript_16763/g.36443  ORF Transcript_16763/g.36443 Transcript_16763/m.36443 type:complete len:260 (+) Transcript_16763:484-1263(+)
MKLSMSEEGISTSFCEYKKSCGHFGQYSSHACLTSPRRVRMAGICRYAPKTVCASRTVVGCRSSKPSDPSPSAAAPTPRAAMSALMTPGAESMMMPLTLPSASCETRPFATPRIRAPMKRKPPFENTWYTTALGGGALSRCAFTSRSYCATERSAWKGNKVAVMGGVYMNTSAPLLFQSSAYFSRYLSRAPNQPNRTTCTPSAPLACLTSIGCGDAATARFRLSKCPAVARLPLQIGCVLDLKRSAEFHGAGRAFVYNP